MNKDSFINKTKLEARIKQLEAEREQTKQLLVMYEGALQDNKYWLSQLEENVENTDG